MTKTPQTTQAPLVVVQNLTHRFSEPGRFGKRVPLTVLDRLSFTLGANEVVGLMGPSGVGKSTLARLLMGLERPSSGEIRIEGLAPQVWRQTHPGAMAAVFQDYTSALNPELTILESLSEPYRLRERIEGAKGVEAATLPDFGAWLAAVGLSPALLTRYPHELSGGQCQRVALVRAVKSDARLVVFDEALSALDAVHQTELLTFLAAERQRLASEGKSCLWVFISHDPEAVAMIASRLIVLRDGHIACDTTPFDYFSQGASNAKSL